MSRSRTLGCLFAVMLLTGCNQVISKAPWFTSEDAAEAPQLRDGLWAITDNPDCRFDEAKPLEQWPQCADALFVRGREYFEPKWEEQGRGGKRRKFITGWSATPALLVGGSPMILQIPYWDDPQGRPDTKADGDADGGEADGYNYAAVAPTLTDEGGRIMAFRAWPILCGPPPESEEKHVTDRPFPGMTIIGNDCTAEDVQALRGAAALSEPFADKPEDAERTVPHWVREGWR